MTNLKSAFRFFVFLFGALGVFAGNFVGQEVSPPNQFAYADEQTEIFSRQLVSGTIEQKRDALAALRNLRTDAASRLAVPALRDKSEIVRATATAAVVFLPPDEAARNLILLLADKKPLVRREAAQALGTVGDPLAVGSLLRVLQKDKVSEVRNAAIVALGAVGEVSVVPELVKILQRQPQSKEEFARRAAARSIGQIAQIIQTGKVRVLTPESFLPESLESIESEKHPHLIAEFPQFQTANGALIEIVRNAQEAPDVRREAAYALGALAEETAIPVLQENVGDQDYYLAEICREALRKIARAQRRRTLGKI